MMRSTSLLTVITAVITTTFIGLTSTDVFTSSLKVHRMIQDEASLLKHLKDFIREQRQWVKEVSKFTHLDEVNKSDILFFHVIDTDSFLSQVKSLKNVYLPDNKDIRGAMLSLLRIQSVYSLRAMDMARGEYLDFLGPQLSSVDAYKIGQLALSVKKLNESIDWLNTSVLLYEFKDFEFTDREFMPSLGEIKALQGSAYLMNGDRHTAMELYSEAQRLHPDNGNLRTLQKELESPKSTSVLPSQQHFHNYSSLCKLSKQHNHVVPVSPLAVCRYRQAVLPYYRFQEEILSISPFISLFYNLTSDKESDGIKDFVRDKLIGCQTRLLKERQPEVRSRNNAWVKDEELVVAAAISRRIGIMTGLATDNMSSSGTLSSGDLEVVNYGLGGHCDVHMDPNDALVSKTKLHTYGERLATVQIFLSDVERGGSTVFTQVGIAVTPVKNMALMWFNFDPALQLDIQTHHGGCPVLIGQKWIVNKWIWTHDNTFRRRCGMTPDVTQLDIEQDMKNGYL